MSNDGYSFRKEKRMGGLTDVPGILVGTAEDESGRTGCTVIVCPDGAVPGVSVVGGNPGTLIPTLFAQEPKRKRHRPFY